MTTSPSLPVRTARWSATHPWRSIALWLVFVAACVALGNAVHLDKASNLDQAAGQSRTAARWLHDAGLEKPDTENVLVTSRSDRLDTAAATAALADAAARMRALHQVSGVGTPVVSPDGTAARRRRPRAA